LTSQVRLRLGWRVLMLLKGQIARRQQRMLVLA
jgi:hypothetical protein